MKPKGYELTMKKGIQTSRMLIWDFAAECALLIHIEKCLTFLV
ncbi:hypothetical protein HMPREF9374_3845 [Desmospora sp. 8437]|nr:hypothetical protein HMPREF9374_3845 [Desmospora sp. 8437]